jgi:transcriptional regulator with XRE-family HTH domain
MAQKLTMGEKLKVLRKERGLTTKEVCRLTGVSENIYNGLENDIGRDTGYSRIVALERFYGVPMDYLLGFAESKIARNVELNELEYSDKVVTALLSKKQSPALISKLIEHPDFTHLINAIDVYVR